mmetsp:Transcript_81248/g.173896  ORF Transcript_81248/g.173896 Transcript_81248/m.173896 type:complete len:201 (-) Transcript_81248:8-610(-)
MCRHNQDSAEPTPRRQIRAAQRPPAETCGQPAQKEQQTDCARNKWRERAGQAQPLPQRRARGGYEAEEQPREEHKDAREQAQQGPMCEAVGVALQCCGGEGRRPLRPEQPLSRAEAAPPATLSEAPVVHKLLDDQKDTRGQERELGDGPHHARQREHLGSVRSKTRQRHCAWGAWDTGEVQERLQRPRPQHGDRDSRRRH